MAAKTTRRPTRRGPAASPRPSARDRLLAAADELFYAEGVHVVGVDRIVERAGVTKASLYNTFGSKDELVRAYLENHFRRRQNRIASIRRDRARQAKSWPRSIAPGSGPCSQISLRQRAQETRNRLVGSCSCSMTAQQSPHEWTRIAAPRLKRFAPRLKGCSTPRSHQNAVVDSGADVLREGAPLRFVSGRYSARLASEMPFVRPRYARVTSHVRYERARR